MEVKTKELFSLLTPHIKTHGAEFVKRVGFKYHFEVLKNGKEVFTFTIDLKKGTGSVAEGKEGKADAVFTMDDDDMIAVASGALNT